MLMRPGKSEAEAERKLWGRGQTRLISYKTMYMNERFDSNIKYEEITPSMAATTVSVHQHSIRLAVNTLQKHKSLE